MTSVVTRTRALISRISVPVAVPAVRVIVPLLFSPTIACHRSSGNPSLLNCPSVRAMAASSSSSQSVTSPAKSSLASSTSSVWSSEAASTVDAYHQLSKHAYHAYAPARGGGLDWASQPAPFRCYHNDNTNTNMVIALAIPGSTMTNAPPLPSLPYHSLYTNRVTTASSDSKTSSAPASLSLSSLSTFLYYSMSLSAWKQAGKSSWSLRTNPSSGNLHPTELYIILPPGMLPIDIDSAAVVHYAPQWHAIERRASLSSPLWCQLRGYDSKTNSDTNTTTDKKTSSTSSKINGDGSFIISLTSIAWREVWKYGVRGFRYCQHDVGHALAALRFAAQLLGWTVTVIHLKHLISLSYHISHIGYIGE